MSLYTDIVADIITWTNRPTMTAEMDVAIRTALRAAHRSGKYMKDLVTLPISVDSTQQIQTFDLSTIPYRKMARVFETDSGIEYKFRDIDDLIDEYGVYVVDTYTIIGNTLTMRPRTPTSSVSISYYKSPTVSPISAIDSWIAADHKDLIVLSAAATILGVLGEDNIRATVNNLLMPLKADLLAEALREGN